MRMRATAILMMLVAVCFFFGVSPAYAYLDPGAGSYLIQFLMAALLGLTFTAKLYWRKIAGFWSSRFRKANKENAGDG
jgi:hypothetical protein